MCKINCSVLSPFLMKLKRNKMNIFEFDVNRTKNIYHKQLNIDHLSPKLLFPNSTEIQNLMNIELCFKATAHTLTSAFFFLKISFYFEIKVHHQIQFKRIHCIAFHLSLGNSFCLLLCHHP